MKDKNKIDNCLNAHSKNVRQINVLFTGLPRLFQRLAMTVGRLAKYPEFRHSGAREAVHTLGRRHCERSEAIQSRSSLRALKEGAAIQSQKRTRQRSQLSSKTSSSILSPTHNKALSSAFTIVELLVVIVVIAILAAITIVSYTNITKQAHISSLASGLNSSMKALETYKEGTSSTETYPISLATMTNLKLDNAITWKYYVASDTDETQNNSYCLQGTVDNTTESVSSSNTGVSNVACTENGLVGWWKLNGNANDSSGNNNNGTVYGGASPVPGSTINVTNPLSQGAYSFDGADDYIEVADSGSLKNLSQITISLWINPQEIKVAGVIDKNRFSAWNIHLPSANVVRFEGLCTNASQIRFTTITGLSENAWTQVVVVYSGSSEKIYFNNVEQSVIVNNDNTTALTDGSYPVLIGKMSDGFNFDGYIDDIRVYNRALPASEVQTLYNTGAQ